jgi:hypothetical protein
MFEPEFYSACYGLLVSTGNATADLWDKQAFISYFVDGTDTSTKEWRFSGHLGFGGKFWRNGTDHYVSCYPEDETPERRAMIDDLNRQITRLMRRHDTP